MMTDAKIAALKPPKAGQEEHKDEGAGYVRGLRLRVGTSGKKAWIVRARAGSKVINKKVGTYPPMKLAAARRAAERVLDALAKGGSTEALDRTFFAVADHWIENVAKPKNDTWKLQKRRLELHVYPAWRDRKIADIRRSDVRELIEGIEGASLPNYVLALVRPIFRHAIARDWIEASPVEGLSKPVQEQSRDRVLSMEEAAAVWRAAGLLGYPSGTFIRMLMLTGQRRTEVASMQWDDVDLDAATWIIPAADTKAERANLVPLPAVAVSMLRGLPQIGPYVFTNDGKSHFSGYAKAKARLDGYVAAAGIKASPWRLHDLRRTAATHLVRLGVTETVVGRVLNHAPQGITATTYALHSYEPEKRSALDRWAAELMRAVEGKAAGKVAKIRGH